MASLGSTFNTDDVPPSEFTPLPAGDYLVQIIESEVKPTKSGEGKQLVLTFEVLDGECQNRRVWERLNISNPSAQAQSIAQRALADLYTAVGLATVNDSEELHFKPLIVRLKIKDDGGDFGPQNRISRYLPAGGQPPEQKAPPSGDARSTNNGGAQATQQRPATAGPAAGGSRPWKTGTR